MDGLQNLCQKFHIIRIHETSTVKYKDIKEYMSRN